MAMHIFCGLFYILIFAGKAAKSDTTVRYGTLGDDSKTFYEWDLQEYLWIISSNQSSRCEDGAALFKITSKWDDGGKGCSASSFSISAHDRREELCGKKEGTCTIIKSDKSNTNFVAQAEECSPADTIVIRAEQVFPVVVRYKAKIKLSHERENFTVQYDMSHRFIQELETTTDATTMESTTGLETNHALSTIHSLEDTTTSSSKEASPQPGSDHQNNMNNTDRILAILFGILFAVTLVVLIAVALRHYRSTSSTTNSPPTSMTEPRAHPTAVSPEGRSEREVVINQIYEM